MKHHQTEFISDGLNGVAEFFLETILKTLGEAGIEGVKREVLIKRKGTVLIVLLVLVVLNGAAEAYWELYGTRQGEMVGLGQFGAEDIVKRMADNWVYVKIGNGYYWAHDPDGYLMMPPDEKPYMLEIGGRTLPFNVSTFARHYNDFMAFVDSASAIGVVVAQINMYSSHDMLITGEDSLHWVLVLEGSTEFTLPGDLDFISSYGSKFRTVGLPDVGDIVVWAEREDTYGWMTVLEPLNRSAVCDAIDAELDNFWKDIIRRGVEDYRTKFSAGAWYDYLSREQLFAGGRGTADEPYLVATAEQLNNVRQFPDCHFRQVANIDLSDFTTGEGWEPIGGSTPFTGTYDGSSFAITNLRIKAPNKRSVGLFGSVRDGVIKNVNIYRAEVEGNRTVGTLVGHNIGGKIYNCHVSGQVRGHSSVGTLVGVNGGSGRIEKSSAGGSASGVMNVGGLVGLNTDRAVIATSNAASNVNEVPGTTTVFGITTDIQGSMGGLVGFNTASITNCYATGTVTGTTAVGGLVGLNSGYIAYCYALGQVMGQWGIGGLIGVNVSDYELDDASGTVYSSYYNLETTGQKDSGKGEGRTTIQMIFQDGTFVDWDFGNIWMTEWKIAYPIFQWHEFPALTADRPEQESRKLHIRNHTGCPIFQVYVSPAGHNQWIEVLEHVNSIDEGGRITVYTNSSHCFYDVLMRNGERTFVMTDIEVDPEKEVVFTSAHEVR